jgi:hypothetical protein
MSRRKGCNRWTVVFTILHNLFAIPSHLFLMLITGGGIIPPNMQDTSLFFLTVRGVSISKDTFLSTGEGREGENVCGPEQRKAGFGASSPWGTASWRLRQNGYRAEEKRDRKE